MDVKEKTSLTIRMTKQTKAAAREVFDAMGIDMSTAINLFLNQVATDKGFPFRPTVLSPLDIETLRAEEDVAAGRVTEYSDFEEYRKRMESL